MVKSNKLKMHNIRQHRIYTDQRYMHLPKICNVHTPSTKQTNKQTEQQTANNYFILCCIFSRVVPFSTVPAHTSSLDTCVLCVPFNIQKKKKTEGNRNSCLPNRTMLGRRCNSSRDNCIYSGRRIEAGTKYVCVCVAVLCPLTHLHWSTLLILLTCGMWIEDSEFMHSFALLFALNGRLFVFKGWPHKFHRLLCDRANAREVKCVWHT